jgi:Predicted UDP-glucose 6-dehydrogenase
LTGKEIALLGLAFKPDTDDVREAPSLDIAYLLYEEGAKLRVCDPAAMENVRPLLPADIAFAPDIYSATSGVNALILVTEWQEFIQADWQAIKRQMQEPYLIFDGRNALAQDKLIALGFNYVGVGRKVK